MINAWKKNPLLLLKKEINVLVRISLQSKGSGFEPFIEFSFSFKNKLDEKKLSKLVWFFSKRTMFFGEQGHKLP
jgi:hypothetical protein